MTIDQMIDLGKQSSVIEASHTDICYRDAKLKDDFAQSSHKNEPTEGLVVKHLTVHLTKARSKNSRDVTSALMKLLGRAIPPRLAQPGFFCDNRF